MPGPGRPHRRRYFRRIRGPHFPGAGRSLLIIGTSGLVQPAASMGAWAKQHGALVAEVNLDTTPQSCLYDLSLQGQAGELLPQLLNI